ncbi:UDP-4-amino-4,6-dideoxy-N-acetyl-beta-L-altrosamine transaminase [Aliamphritea spongicola]|uniref:UDP-4-amino-4, 6-dideoxy-N-acetyl-beta-L-altrosamine transaminase n=1 Tax=Aliamphritea spongicola TaxID=707589 RepID=UPI00196B25B9|nr:UDP-4-amino-4,6-dideoxy-N-acetyl-beta-L-altrosamine transaminase [Aliamphritea spongicola]MBN3563500.1 UDP-4-amino-4,6-dideoxy-N-acetyl-beta-L-altrosamine transaminase [Aliamphritea spongicola]
MIPYGRQDIIQDDIDTVIETLQSDFITQGPQVALFEKKIAEYCQAKYAIACNSATSALHLACLALGITEGDQVWTSPITFVATANAVKMCGAQVDFVDIDPETSNLSVSVLKSRLSQAEKQNALPKAIIVVHMAGLSCDMAEISSLTQKYDIKIIEDAAHAIGGSYQDAKIGACQYSDITVFSFHPVKIITTAEGGLATTNNPVLAATMEQLRSHGVTRDEEKLQNTADGPWYYEQHFLGFNYRITDIQAALGISQLKRLDDYVKARNALAKRYNDALSVLPVRLPEIYKDRLSAFHLYIIKLNTPDRSEHLRLFKALRKEGIGVNLHYIPVYRQPFYQEQGFKRDDFPNSEAYYQSAITLPLFPTMTFEEQDKVIETLVNLLK